MSHEQIDAIRNYSPEFWEEAGSSLVIESVATLLDFIEVQSRMIKALTNERDIALKAAGQFGHELQAKIKECDDLRVKERPIVQSAIKDIGIYTEMTASHEVLAAALIVRAYVFDLELNEAGWRKVLDVAQVEINRLTAERDKLQKDLDHKAKWGQQFVDLWTVSEKRMQQLQLALRTLCGCVNILADEHGSLPCFDSMHKPIADARTALAVADGQQISPVTGRAIHSDAPLTAEDERKWKQALFHQPDGSVIG